MFLTQVLQNARLDTVFFASYLHYLYHIKEFEGIEEMVEVLTYLRLKPEVEYLTNFALLLTKLKAIQRNADVSDFMTKNIEETKELADELFNYFETECPLDELKAAAEYLKLVLSRHIVKDISPVQFKEGLKKLVEANPARYEGLLGKHLQ